ncbi:LPS export ABC transporter periplasmic protein LptC [Pseudomonas oryzae]|uniref:Lipopolysaccharide export system protein LptC n=1 Tax=Pseudomonas oryzae TaxID=1392877 RepID=A0A1H1LCN7_9PSED|nr:LPS export ABC transporter periplasmic protein LptC [Pseudomonas oryzae]SDR72082.1 lipopolysaccharide export system protein LptC [Pseudomonas oryzae]
MNRTLRTFFPFALAAALLAAIGYWNIRPESFMEPSAATGGDSAIDFFVENARSVQFQADGKLHYRMTATRLEHLRSSDTTLLSQPDLLLYRGSDYPWHVQSERGEVSPGGTQVELIDAVRVERTDAKGRPTILTTSRLSVFPEREYAETAQPVRIEAANGVTSATGMQAYLNESRMLLKSNVRGQHEVR